MNLREQARQAAQAEQVRAETLDRCASEDDLADAVSDAWEPVVSKLLVTLAVYAGYVEVSTINEEQKRCITDSLKLLKEYREAGSEADRG